MILYGSTTSPYVRRLRLVLYGKPYEFKIVQVFQDEFREDFAKLNPVMKVPALIDGATTLFDSNIIAEYIYAQMSEPFLSITQKNILATINGMLDSLVQVMILSREGITNAQAPTYIGLQKERTELCFAFLDEQITKGTFVDWDYLTISLYTTLDWIVFREMADFSDYPNLKSFYDHYKMDPRMQATDPRL